MKPYTTPAGVKYWIRQKVIYIHHHRQQEDKIDSPPYRLEEDIGNRDGKDQMKEIMYNLLHSLRLRCACVGVNENSSGYLLLRYLNY